MDERNKKKKKQKILFGVFYMLFMMVCGYGIGYLIGKIQKDYLSEGDFGIEKILYIMSIALVAWGIGWMAHVYIHEMGHMIFGLLTGYKFQSIRFGSFIFVKTSEGVKLKKIKIAGTGGQCLMLPPDTAENDFPTALYNWGGCIANLMVSSVCFVIYLGVEKQSVLAMILVISSLIGLGSALINGIPISSLSNDGYNARILKKDRDARKAFNITLKINNSFAQGLSVKEMPQEWFVWEKKVPENNLTASMGVMYFSYLIECKQFQAAKETGEFLLENAKTLADIHEIVLKAELLFCDMMTDEKEEEIKEKLKKESKKFMTLKALPSIQRILYGYYLMIEKDTVKAEESLKCFEKLAKKYPYPKEIVSERELIALAEEKAKLI